MKRNPNIKRLKSEWRKKFYPNQKHYLQDIKLSNTVWITDPCYKKWGTKYQGKIDNLVPGIYTPVVEYNREWRVKKLMVFKVWTTDHKFKVLPFDIWVDSWQCGIFCDSIYPKDSSYFYNDCCERTSGKKADDSQKAYQYICEIERQEDVNNKLENLADLMNTWGPHYKAGTIQDRWVVSLTSQKNWDYKAYLSKTNDAIFIRYI
jgi:hypothetical protein